RRRQLRLGTPQPVPADPADPRRPPGRPRPVGRAAPACHDKPPAANRASAGRRGLTALAPARDDGDTPLNPPRPRPNASTAAPNLQGPRTRGRDPRPHPGPRRAPRPRARTGGQLVLRLNAVQARLRFAVL